MVIYNKDDISTYPYSASIHSTPQLFHTHTFWEISICCEGKAKNIFNNGHTIDFNPGDVFIIRPGDCHYIKPISKPIEYTHRDIYIFPEKFKKICDCFYDNLYDELLNGDSPEKFHISLSDIHNINAQFNCFLNANDAEMSFDLIHTSLVSFILGLYFRSKYIFKSTYPIWVSELLYKLNTIDFFTQSVDDLIKDIPYSRSLICHKFKTFTGTTIHNYVTDIKMKKAASLLDNSDMNISQIAYKLGYNSASNFTTAFKNYYNLSPKDWKYKNRN